jgi:hypothetical protein
MHHFGVYFYFYLFVFSCAGGFGGHPGMGHPPVSAGDASTQASAPPPKEKKKRRKKKKADDIDTSTAQPLPASLPSQAALSKFGSLNIDWLVGWLID